MGQGEALHRQDGGEAAYRGEHTANVNVVRCRFSFGLLCCVVCGGLDKIDLRLRSGLWRLFTFFLLFVPLLSFDVGAAWTKIKRLCGVCI